MEIENKQLKNTLDEYHEEFAQVKNQEVTIKGLKDKIKEIEAMGEQQVVQRLKEKEKELQRSYADKEEQLQATQLDLVKKLGKMEFLKKYFQYKRFYLSFLCSFCLMNLGKILKNDKQFLQNSRK